MGGYGRGWGMKRQWARGGGEDKGHNHLRDEADANGVGVCYLSNDTTKLKSCYLFFYNSVLRYTFPSQWHPRASIPVAPCSNKQSRQLP
jgi:hypothetical protein